MPDAVPPAVPLTTAAELAAVLDDVPAVVALFDTSLRNRFANWAHLAWFGLDPRDLVGCSPADIVGDAVFEEAQPFYAAALQGEPQTFERIVPLPGGGSLHTLVRYVPYVVAGEIRGVVTMASDVTGRVRTQFARQELATRAAAIGAREVRAIDKQNAATAQLARMASELASVARRHPELGETIPAAARAMGEAADRLRTLAAHRPGPGRPPGPERAVRQRIDEAAAVLGFTPSLLVMGVLDELPDEITSAVAEALDVTLDNIARHADATRVDVTISVEHGDVVVVVADDGSGMVRPRAGSGLDRLRQLATSRDGSCSWFINADEGITVEWRAPVLAAPADEEAKVNGASALPVDPDRRAPEDLRRDVALDDVEMRALLEHVPIGLAVWGVDLRNQYANATAAQWFDLPDPREMLGRPYSEMVDAESFDRVLPMAQAAFAGAHVVIERPFTVRGPGRPRHIRAEFLPRLRDGAVVGLNVQVTDIGERVRAESAMRSEQARIDSLRERHAAEEEVHHLAIQEVFAAAMRLDTLRLDDPAAQAELDNALAPLDAAVADLRESVVTTEAQPV